MTPNRVLQFPISMTRYAQQRSDSARFESGLRGNAQTAEIIEFPRNDLANTRAAIREIMLHNTDGCGRAFPDFD